MESIKVKIVGLSLLAALINLPGCALLHQTKPVKENQIQDTYAGAGAGFSTGLMATATVPIPLGVAVGGALGLTKGTQATSVNGLSDKLHQSGAQVVQVGDRVSVYLPADKLFKENSDKIKPSAYTMLTYVATMAQHYQQGKIEISGHTDNVMSKTENQDISERQAQSVEAYLWAEGIPRDNVIVTGKAAVDPIANNVTSMGSAANRHVLVVFTSSRMI